jgi:hypothetical protein
VEGADDHLDAGWCHFLHEKARELIAEPRLHVDRRAFDGIRVRERETHTTDITLVQDRRADRLQRDRHAELAGNVRGIEGRVRTARLQRADAHRVEHPLRLDRRQPAAAACQDVGRDDAHHRASMFVNRTVAPNGRRRHSA